MTRLRLLAWLLTLAALIAPPGWPKPVAAMAAHHAMTNPAMTGSMAAVPLAAVPMMSDCSEHVPPPACPDEGNAKHAAATCCPSMSGTLALPLTGPLPSAVVRSAAPAAWRAPMLQGRVPAADPPPPRS